MTRYVFLPNSDQALSSVNANIYRVAQHMTKGEHPEAFDPENTPLWMKEARLKPKAFFSTAFNTRTVKNYYRQMLDRLKDLRARTERRLADVDVDRVVDVLPYRDQYPETKGQALARYDREIQALEAFLRSDVKWQDKRRLTDVMGNALSMYAEQFGIWYKDRTEFESYLKNVKIVNNMYNRSETQEEHLKGLLLKEGHTVVPTTVEEDRLEKVDVKAVCDGRTKRYQVKAVRRDKFDVLTDEPALQGVVDLVLRHKTLAWADKELGTGWQGNIMLALRPVLHPFDGEKCNFQDPYTIKLDKQMDVESLVLAFYDVVKDGTSTIYPNRGFIEFDLDNRDEYKQALHLVTLNSDAMLHKHTLDGQTVPYLALFLRDGDRRYRTLTADGRYSEWVG